MRKSRREKEKEAADLKKKEEEEDAARAYAEFIDTFEGEDVGRKAAGMSFVKAGGDAASSYAGSTRRPPDGPSRMSGAFDRGDKMVRTTYR